MEQSWGRGCFDPLSRGLNSTGSTEHLGWLKTNLNVWINHCSRLHMHKKLTWMEVLVHSVKAKSQKWKHKKAKAERKSARNLKQFVIFKPLSYCFKETIIGFDKKALLAIHPVLRLIRWYNKPGDITKEFWEKAVEFHGTFHGLKIANCKHLYIWLENSAEGLGSRRECCWGYVSMMIHPKSYHIFPHKVVATLLSVSWKSAVGAQ